MGAFWTYTDPNTGAPGYGPIGIDEVSISIIEPPPPIPADCLHASIYIPAGLDPLVPDTIRYFYGTRDATAADPAFTEADTQTGSLLFRGIFASSYTEVVIDPATCPGLTSSVDSFRATVTHLFEDGSIMSLSALFTETGAETKVFRATYELPSQGTQSRWCWDVGGCAVGGAGRFFPCTIRVRGIPEAANLEDLSVTFDGGASPAQLNRKGDGYVYIKGPSTAIGYVYDQLGGGGRFFDGYIELEKGDIRRLGPVPVLSDKPGEVEEAINTYLKWKGVKVAYKGPRAPTLGLLIGHGDETGSQDNCPRKMEWIPMYCLIQIGPVWYYGDGPNIPSPKPGSSMWHWDQKTYRYNAAPYSWVDKYQEMPLSSVTPLSKYRNNLTIQYNWFRVEAARDPKETPSPMMKTGVKVKYRRIPINVTGWNPELRFDEGCWYIYCEAALLQNGTLLWYSPTLPVGSDWTRGFPRPNPNLNEAYTEQKDLALRFIKPVHKVICGAYTGGTRTLPEWAATHIKLPYCYGPKDRYVGEDCTGLVLGATMAYTKGNTKLTSTTADKWVKNFASYGLELLTSRWAGKWEKANEDEFWEIMDKVEPEHVNKGVFIFHSRSFDKPGEASHVVVVDSIDKVKREVQVIEAQGWDDEVPPNHVRIPRGNLEDPVFTKSEQRVVRHEYISQYLQKKQANGNSYIGWYWILRFPPQ